MEQIAFALSNQKLKLRERGQTRRALNQLGTQTKEQEATFF